MVDSESEPSYCVMRKGRTMVFESLESGRFWVVYVLVRSSDFVGDDGVSR